MLNKSPYTVLARKYRPTSFSKVVGQGVLVQAITNAINLGRVSHAILLTGIRGTGKTTIARLIAKSLNCVSSSGSIVESCGHCDQCVTISKSCNQDVLEMDAASHTSVNDVREIIENSKYKPTAARNRIYIIDEVHMLSTSAFNALLKILEEPPVHVKFIFATTEAQKIPLTIVSRCQRFHLRRLTVPELAGHYEKILKDEGYSADPSALNMVATAAAGSVRDGLSILDQVIVTCGEEIFITEQLVAKVLGIANLDGIFKLFSLIIKGKISAALKIGQEMYNDGSDPVMIVEELLLLVHNLSKLVALSQGSQKSMNFSFDTCQVRNYGIERLQPLLDLLYNNMSFLLISWHILLEALNEMKIIEQPFVCLETALIKLCYVDANKNADHEEEVEVPDAKLESTQSERRVRSIGDSAVCGKVEDCCCSGMPELEEKNSNNMEPPDYLKSAIKDLLTLLTQHNEMVLCHWLTHDVGIAEINLEIPLLKMQIHRNAPQNIKVIVASKLSDITGKTWQIEILPSTYDGYVLTFGKFEKKEKQEHVAMILKNKIVQDILVTFDGVEVEKIIT
ncbi:DNA polymerase III subunit gamma/tau [Alphaproteobacteria bacterium]